MPTFIGPSGGGGNNQIADAIKNVLQQTSPINLAHAALYGASTRKTQAEADSAQTEADALKLLGQNGIYNPNDPRMAGALVVAKRAADALALNRARQASLYGAASPEADAAAVGAGGSFTTTAMGQGRDLASQEKRTGMTNDTSVRTTGMNNQTTLTAEREKSDAALRQKQWEVENTPQMVMIPDGRGGMKPAYVNKSAAVNPATRAQPVLSTDQAIGGAMQVDPDYQPPAPAGVMQGGAVPGQIPPTPSFIPQPPAPVSPTQTVQVPLAHDLTNTVDVPTQLPQPPQPPSIVNPPLTPPPGLVPQAPGQSRVSSVIDSLDPRVRNAKGLNYPARLTFINPATNQTGVSEDGGRTVIVNGVPVKNDGSFKQAGPETGVSETRNAVAKGSIQPFQPADPRVGQIFQSAIKPGVGGVAGFVQQDVNTLLGSTGIAALLPGGQFGADQNAARQRLEIFNNQMSKALLGARSGEAGIKEQSKISSLLPSTGIFTNPATEAGKVVQLYGQLMEQNRALVSRLQRPETTGASFEKMRAMLDENETALRMITDPAWATKYTGEVQGGMPGAAAAPAGDAVEFNQRPGGPPPPGQFKILGVRDK